MSLFRRSGEIAYKGAMLFASYFGRSNIMFDFATVIPELPASQFFWYHLVEEQDKLKYRYYLSKLLTLFILPHHLPVFPFEECSYLKKYERHISDSKETETLMQGLIYILRLNTSNITVVYPLENYILKYTLHNETAEELPKSLSTLQKSIRPWLKQKQNNTVLVLYLSTNNETGTQGHANLLALKKTMFGTIQYLYFNPHGLYESIEQIKTFRKNLKLKLQNICEVPVKEVLTSCPNLQTSDQGGNCKQWFAMIFCFLCMNPALFDDPKPLLENLGKHPQLNIVLFELSIFLRTMPLFGLKNYYFATFKGSHTLGYDVFASVAQCKTDDAAIKTWLYSAFGERDCNTFDTRSCPFACSICNGQCVSTAALKQEVEGTLCRLLNPKEIAAEMFGAYLKIKTLSNQLGDTLSFTLEKMQSQLDSVLEITSLQDYVTRRLLSAAQVQAIEQLLSRTAVVTVAVAAPTVAVAAPTVAVAAPSVPRLAVKTAKNKRKRQEEEEDVSDRRAKTKHF
jgi:ribosomal protein L12E/L44/L45/RPP1/RPP2